MYFLTALFPYISVNEHIIHSLFYMRIDLQLHHIKGKEYYTFRIITFVSKEDSRVKTKAGKPGSTNNDKSE